MGWIARYRAKKEQADGQDRQPEADHQDPGTGTCVCTGACYITGTCPHPGTKPSPIGKWFMANGPSQGQYASGGYSGLSMHTSLANTGVYGVGVSPLSDSIEFGPFPDITEDIPILARRVAVLRMGYAGPELTSFNERRALSVDADFECLCNILGPSEEHLEPTPQSTCGFYAVPADLVPEYRTHETVDVEVELSGVVIEHQFGYRASHQRILAVEFSRCRRCAEPTTHVLFSKSAGHVKARGCGEHLTGNPDRIYSLEELEKFLGVPVRSTS